MQSEVMTMENRPTTDRPADTMTGEGKLIFQVSTGGGAIPLEGAVVTVRQGPVPAGWRAPAPGGEGPMQTPMPDGTMQPLQPAGTVISVMRTGPDGKTPPLSLPAPSRNLSLFPSRDGAPAPYSLYDADVSYPEYYAQSYIRIPVFDGITSVQQAALIPLPENGYPDGYRPDSNRFYEGASPDL